MSAWFPFWRSRDKFSPEELRYVTDELQKVQFVNSINEDFIIEVLRSIAELMTYGDQHDTSYFEFFMEKHIMGEFARILRISKSTKVLLQLLQTMSIMIENIRNEHSIYYIFSNNHINYLITYPFDFQNEELLSYYVSFLRAISGELNKKTISLLVKKTRDEEVVFFPLYVQAIKFAFHEENMVRIAVRALTLNIYNVGDEYVNRYVKCNPQSDYFPSIIRYICTRCIILDELVTQTARKLDVSVSGSSILDAIDEIEDNLYYLDDIISARVPNLERLLSDNILQLLVFPLLMPSLKKKSAGTQVSITTSLHLLCSILHIIQSKDLANTMAAALLCPLEVLIPRSEATEYGYVPKKTVPRNQDFASCSFFDQENIEYLKSPSPQPNHFSSQNGTCGSHITLRELVLSCIVGSDESQVLASLCLLATLLQTRELDESVLDGLGILPQRRQHKNVLLEQYSYHTKCEINSKLHRYQVVEALVSLFCRSSISGEILWLGGWILRQLLSHGKEEFATVDLRRLQDSHKLSARNLFEEIKGTWCDVFIPLLKDEWRICKKAIEASSPPMDFKSILLSQRFSSRGESSFAAAGRMCQMVKVFVLQRYILLFTLGESLRDLPDDSSVISRTKTSVFNAIVPKPGSEISLVNALPCATSFKSGNESDLEFLATSRGPSGWLLLAEESPDNQQCGIVRVSVPLAGSDPKIDEECPKWLHLRVRPSTFPLDPTKFDLLKKVKAAADGQWTLAFEDEQACAAAKTMLIEELNMHQSEVAQRLKHLLQHDMPDRTPDRCIVKSLDTKYD